MRPSSLGLSVFLWALVVSPASARRLVYPGLGRQCLKCHEKTTPGVVSEWRGSLHGEAGVGCVSCHGANVHCAQCHGGGSEVRVVSPETCGGCHDDRLRQFQQGNHAGAWTVMKAMPGAHAGGSVSGDSTEDCRRCHAIGLKTEEEVKTLGESGAATGIASCDACHPRHGFSAKAARRPEACRPCHSGSDQAQWEMYTASPHGMLSRRGQEGSPPEPRATPTCQRCHMSDGDHGVRTAWGGFALRGTAPSLSKDRRWREDRATILRALGGFDREATSGAELESQDAAEEDWRQGRERLLGACYPCHPEPFAREALEKADEVLKASDHLLAEALRVVERLYRDGVLEKPNGTTEAVPLLALRAEAQTPIEKKLLDMHLALRMRLLQAAAHLNAGEVLEEARRAMRRALSEMEEQARELRDAHRRR